MQPVTRNVRLDIRLIATGTEKPLLLATLTGWTPATDSVLSQMILQWCSAAQGVIFGSIQVEMMSDGTTTYAPTAGRLETSGSAE